MRKDLLLPLILTALAAVIAAMPVRAADLPHVKTSFTNGSDQIGNLRTN